MLDWILKPWSWLSNLGVSEEYEEENELIRSYNRMSFLSAMGTLALFLSGWLIEFSTVYLTITFFVICFYLSVIVLNGFGQIWLARYSISIGSPIWICLCYLFTGGNFCQGLAISASMMITYVAFQKRMRISIAILVFHVVVFFFVMIYVNTYGSIYGIIDFPYDELVVFLGGLGWTVIQIYLFDKNQKSLLQDLKANNKELVDTTEELERFTYIASHDLKSPLRTIISFVNLIEWNLKKENYSEIHKNLSFVKTGAEQMHFLVQDILELSKLKTLKQSERSLIDLNLVLEKAVHNLKEEIKEKSVTIHCDDLPPFVGNELEFLLLFQNFIQNGIKYNESNPPEIHISATEVNHHLHLSFQDNGIGIEAEYHDQIFQFFKRLHNASEYQGTGLGLGLCKKIIDSYQGEIKVDSRLGEGTKFTILLPLASTIGEKQHLHKAAMLN